MPLRHALLLALSLTACSTPTRSAPPTPEAALALAEDGSPAWAVRMDSVRAALEEVRLYHSNRDKRAATEAWLLAYRSLFEPGIEEPVREMKSSADLVSSEYAFGQLLMALDTPDHDKLLAALAGLTEKLDALEATLLAPH